MFISPLLNKAIENFTKREFIRILIIFSFLVFYFGLVCQDGIIAKGKSILYFIYIYLIGRYTRIYRLGESWKKRHLLIFIVGWEVLLLLLNFVLPHGILKPFRGFVFAYIGPGQLVFSIILLILFSKIRIKSKVLNYVAVSTLSIYLFHENIFIPLNHNFALYAYHFDMVQALGLILISSFLIMFISLLLDMVIVRNILLILEPLANKVVSCFLQYIKRFFKISDEQ